MDNRNNRFWFILGLSAGLLACLVMVLILYFVYIKPQSSEPDEQALTQTSVMKTITITKTPVLTGTPTTLTNTPNPTISEQGSNVDENVTPISGGLLISANLDTNCRSGPDTPYEIMGHLQRGQTSEVVGSNALQTWWYIQNPDNPNNYCWVWGETTAVQGNTSQLAVITPPPPPPPKIGYSIVHTGIENCGVPVAMFEVTNDGGRKLESISILIYDVTREFQIYWMSKINQPFWSKQENCYPDWSYMDIGDVAFIGGDISTGVLGDKARARITICTEDSLEGECLEQSIDFTIPYR